MTGPEVKGEHHPAHPRRIVDRRPLSERIQDFLASLNPQKAKPQVKQPHTRWRPFLEEGIGRQKDSGNVDSERRR